MTTERPIIFNGDMIRALLDGRKTQTRRIVKPGVEPWRAWNWIDLCPYGIPGDRLWVRETHFIVELPEPPAIEIRPPHVLLKRPNGYAIVSYKADEDYHDKGGWRPSIHMPRWSSRLTLEVCSVKVERVGDIREEDAEAEGVERTSLGFRDYELPANVMHGVPAAYSFQTLWDSIYAKRPGCSFADSPWCWCITFRVHERRPPTEDIKP